MDSHKYPQKYQRALGVAMIGFGVIVGSGCGNSSNSIENHNQSLGNSQAIDGYIVDGAVYCDGVRNGRTQAAGRFDCPSPTNVAQVRGGMDVGFDEAAISGGIPFAGELKAPGGAPYVTPLSTIATNMASSDGTFDPTLYEDAVETLATSLDLDDLDLEESPVVNLSLAKANAKINQLVINFADSSDEYSVVTEQLAKALTASVPLSLNADAATIVSALNERLVFAAPELSVSAAEQTAIVEVLEKVNAAIDQSVSAKQVGDVIEEENGGSPYVFSIDRSAPLVRFGNPNDQSIKFYSLQEFENSSLGLFGYSVAKEAEASNVEFATSAFDVRQSVTNADVDLAIEFTSTDANDDRHISIIMYGASLSMTEGLSNSVQISVPDNALLFAQAMDEMGVVTNITTLAGEDYFSTNANGNFSFAFSTLNRELSDRGYYNFTRESGNYEVTMVIGGLGFGVEQNTGSISDPAIHSISTATRTVTGNGLHGYFTTR
jgi:hypothetical protein